MPQPADHARRLPSLEGLRALAVSLVLLRHLGSGHTIPALDYLWRAPLLGDIGVRIFFVLSGFLITTLLHREHSTTGRIDLPGFVRRRALRILPAYYAMLAFVALASPWAAQELSAGKLLAAFLFASDYVEMPRVIAHAWSLAVEQQFYLCWPLLLVLLGWRRAAWLVLGFCLVAPMLRWRQSTGMAEVPVLWSAFETSADAVGTGCLYAIARAAGRIPKTSGRAASAMVAAGLAGLLLASCSAGWPMAWNVLGTVIANLLAVVLLHGGLNAHGTSVGRMLNAAPVRAVGVLSYSLYLWQQVFIYGAFKLSAPANLAAILAASVLSYLLVERPFLRWKSTPGLRRSAC